MIATITGAEMKAIVSERPGKPRDLRLKEINRPEVPEDGVLVRVHASSANPVDLFATSTAGYLMGGRKPAVLGTDFAGVVESVGANVTEFRPGDEVFGGAAGSFAEYVVVRAGRAVARKPAGVSFADAGTIGVAASTALQALRNHGRIEPGQKVLINGASGGVGTFAVQLAIALGGEVTAVCSARNVEMVRSLGATRVIDYTKEDFTRDSDRYDLMVDVAGSHSFSKSVRVLAPDGTFVLTGLAAVQHGRGGLVRVLGRFGGAKLGSIMGRRRVGLFITQMNREDLDFLAGLLASGQVKPVIEKTYPLAEAGTALTHLNEGHARAKLAIEIAA